MIIILLIMTLNYKNVFLMQKDVNLPHFHLGRGPMTQCRWQKIKSGNEKSILPLVLLWLTCLCLFCIYWILFLRTFFPMASWLFSLFSQLTYFCNCSLIYLRGGIIKVFVWYIGHLIESNILIVLVLHVVVSLNHSSTVLKCICWASL